MARIRTIKPEFPQSESMGNVSRDARLCFILLWTVADDSGRLRGNSRMLASLLYPYDDDAKKLIDGWLDQLEREHCIARYQVDGASYVQIENWRDHQKIDKPSASKLPAFDRLSRILANPLEGSSEEGIKEGIKDQGVDQGMDQGAPRKSPPSNLASKPDGVSQAVWDDFVLLRKKKEAPLTVTAMNGIIKEATKAGISIESALEETCTRGWRSFKAEWYAKSSSGKPNSKHSGFAELDYTAGVNDDDSF